MHLIKRAVKFFIADQASTISFPKGANVSSTNFKCCLPNGIPMMVINNNAAKTRCTTAVYNPPVKIQMILNNKLRQLPDEGFVTTFFPNGKSSSIPILKHCMPNGMPIMVIQKTKPVIKYPNAEKKPPQISQIKLPIAFICTFFLFVR